MSTVAPPAGSRSDAPFIRRTAQALGFSGAVALVAYRRRSLDRSGAAGAIGVGTATWLAGGFRWSTILLGFFASSSALSRLESRSAGGQAIAAMTGRGAQRDLVQALANGGIAAGAAVLFTLSRAEPAAAAFAGALAAANSDTWATEIGGLSPTPPTHILHGRTVPVGTSGGVTAVGLAGAAAGAALIGLLAGSLQYRRRSLRHGTVVTVAGMAGSLCDSVVGATLQASYWCPQCQKATERRIHSCGTRTQLVRGHPWCTNDLVNVACTGVGAGLAALLSILRQQP